MEKRNLEILRKKIIILYRKVNLNIIDNCKEILFLKDLVSLSVIFINKTYSFFSYILAFFSIKRPLRV